VAISNDISAACASASFPRSAPSDPEAGQGIEARLMTLNNLRKKKLISDEEFARRRAEILQSI